MGGDMGDTRYTLREVAKATGAAYRTVAAYAQKAGWTKNGRITLLTDEQVTVILEAMKRGTNNQHDLASRSQGIETGQSRVLQLYMLHKQMQKIYEAEIADMNKRLTVAEAAYGREVLDHNATKALLGEREAGLALYQRICENHDLMLSDRDDLSSAYRGKV
jgi:hypothetical protein